MRERPTADQHAKDHAPSVDQAQLNLALDRTNAHAHRDEDARLELTARGPYVTAPDDLCFDRHPTVTFAPAEPYVESNPPCAELADVFHVQRARSGASVDFCAQAQDSPFWNVDVLGHADHERCGCAPGHAGERYYSGGSRAKFGQTATATGRARICCAFRGPATRSYRYAHAR